MIPVPRFQGNAIKKDDGWSFEFIFSMLGHDEGQLYSSNDIYKTKEEAIKQLKLAIQFAIKTLAEEIPELGIKAEEYIDMKTNITRPWDKKDEH